jgi:chaperonin GroES
MSLKPIRDFIVVSPIKVENKTPSGLLHMPATVESKVIQGKVMAVGSGYRTATGALVPLEVQAGDTVLFSKQASVEIEHQGERYHLLREEQVASIVN